MTDTSTMLTQILTAMQNSVTGANNLIAAINNVTTTSSGTATIRLVAVST